MIHQSFPNNSMDEPRWCYLNAFDSVHNAQVRTFDTVRRHSVAGDTVDTPIGSHMQL
jgi:hypothetical protein